MSEPTPNDLPPGPLPVAWLRAHPRAADVLLVAFLLVGVVVLGVSRHESSEVPDALTVAAALVGTVALVLRRRFPVQVWVVTLAVAVLGLVSAQGPTPALFPAIIGLYTLAVSRPRRTGALAAAVTGLVLVVTSVVALGSTWSSPEPWALLAWSGMPAAIGDAVRSQREIVRAARERALRAEATREDEAQRRVAEERLRIARELHDVVAHHIAVITVQAGVAPHLLDTDRGQAREALDHVRTAGQTVLNEMSTILGVLREEPGEDRHPAPGLAGVDALVVEARRAGLLVTLRVSGSASELPAVVDLAAHRLIQEALTNARKHGGGSAVVDVTHLADRVVLTVTNPLGPDSHLPPGHGLVGMRERVTTAGGTLEVGPRPDGLFHVRAELPVDPAAPIRTPSTPSTERTP